VLFDIPQKMHKQRNILRRKLQTMGFTMLQRSVFAVPYPCEIELDIICHELRIEDYVSIFIAQTLDRWEDDLKKRYRL
jgi:CRISPR-associated endonuclease Cas2